MFQCPRTVWSSLSVILDLEVPVYSLCVCDPKPNTEQPMPTLGPILHDIFWKILSYGSPKCSQLFLFLWERSLYSGESGEHEN